MKTGMIPTADGERYLGFSTSVLGVKASRLVWLFETMFAVQGGRCV